MGEFQKEADKQLEELRLRTWHVFYGAIIYMLWVNGTYLIAVYIGRYLLKDPYVETLDFYYRVGYLLSAGWIFHKFLSEDNY